MSTKRSFTLALALLLVAAMPARATSVPTLTVIDTINPGADSSSPLYFTPLGDYLYFRAGDATHGRELWRTNGTTTTLVEDINSGADDSYPIYFTALGNWLYFLAFDETHGEELWRTNGTTTTLVADINSGRNNSDLVGFTALGAYLYFSATDGTHGAELWRTNGTTTTLVADINTGTSGADESYPADFTALGDFLYFRATDATHGRELWRTSGTVTERVPFPVVGQSIDCETVYSCIPSIVAVGGRLYTTVWSSDIGLEFAYLDEPTYVLPETSRDGSLWTATLVILAGLTAAASIGLRLRGARRA